MQASAEDAVVKFQCTENLMNDYFDMEMSGFDDSNNYFTKYIVKKKLLSQQLQLIKRATTTDYSQTFCKYGVGYITYVSVIEDKPYFVAVAFVKENKWKISNITFDENIEEIKRYVDRFKKK